MDENMLLLIMDGIYKKVEKSNLSMSEIIDICERAVVKEDKDSLIADIEDMWHDCLSGLKDSELLAEMSAVLLDFANVLESLARIFDDISNSVRSTYGGGGK